MFKIRLMFSVSPVTLELSVQPSLQKTWDLYTCQLLCMSLPATLSNVWFYQHHILRPLKSYFCATGLEIKIQHLKNLTALIFNIQRFNVT